nr:hypothetical protein [Tanacetum cinerariifolium]
MMVQAEEEIGEGSVSPTDPYHTPIIIQQSTSQPSRKHKSTKTKRNDSELPQTSVPREHVADEAIYEEMNDSLERATSTATSLDVEQDRGNISKTQSKATPNEPSSSGTSSGGVNTPQSGKDDLSRRSRTHGLKRLYKVGLSERVESSVDEAHLNEEDESKQGRIYDIDANQDIYLVNVYKDENIFGVNNQDDTLMFNAISFDELTLAQALMEIKTSNLRQKEFLCKSQVKLQKTTTTIIPPIKSQEEGKEIMVEPEMSLKKKAQISIDEEIAFKLQAKEEEQERIRLQAKEKEQLIGAKKARLFIEFLEKRKKLFAKLFDKAMARINNFVVFIAELVEESTKKDKAETVHESSSKRAGDELEQEKSKKQKVNDDKEQEEFKKYLKYHSR